MVLRAIHDFVCLSENILRTQISPRTPTIKSSAFSSAEYGCETGLTQENTQLMTGGNQTLFFNVFYFVWVLKIHEEKIMVWRLAHKKTSNIKD